MVGGGGRGGAWVGNYKGQPPADICEVFSSICLVIVIDGRCLPIMANVCVARHCCCWHAHTAPPHTPRGGGSRGLIRPWFLWSSNNGSISELESFQFRAINTIGTVPPEGIALPPSLPSPPLPSTLSPSLSHPVTVTLLALHHHQQQRQSTLLCRSFQRTFSQLVISDEVRGVVWHGAGRGGWGVRSTARKLSR